MEIKRMFMANEASSGFTGGYSDMENIEYETVSDSLKKIRDRVSAGSELEKEITKLHGHAEELVQAWKSPTAAKAKDSVEQMEKDLKLAQEELNRLIAEVDKYNTAAKAIDEGMSA